MPFPVALVSAAFSLGSGLFAAGKARRAASRARGQKIQAENHLKNLENSRQKIINPFRNISDLSGLATDLSSMVSNPFANLGVATSAAEIQIEQADISLANALDTLRATGASAGGATALAQAAKQSKKEVSANIEQQEMQNEKLSAQGEQQMERLQMQEAARIQGIQISEGQRLQNAEAQGEQFMFSTREGRQMQGLNRAAGMADRYAQQEMQSGINATAAMSGAVSALGSLAGAAIGANATKYAADLEFGIDDAADVINTSDTSQSWNGSKASSAQCFAAGTQVLSIDGQFKNIEDFIINDKVITGSGTVGIVKKQITHVMNDVIPMYAKNGIQTTGDHPLFVNNTWTNAKKLNWDHKFIFIDKLYNLEIVAQDSTYVVNNIIASGKISTLVDNKKIKQI